MTRRDPQPTGSVVDARLRRVAALSRRAHPWPALVDMSREAVTARLLACSEVSALALALARAGAHDDRRAEG